MIRDAFRKLRERRKLLEDQLGNSLLRARNFIGDIFIENVNYEYRVADQQPDFEDDDRKGPARARLSGDNIEILSEARQERNRHHFEANRSYDDIRVKNLRLVKRGDDLYLVPQPSDKIDRIV